jgi:hypothetical protein
VSSGALDTQGAVAPESIGSILPQHLIVLQILSSVEDTAISGFISKLKRDARIALPGLVFQIDLCIRRVDVERWDIEEGENVWERLAVEVGQVQEHRFLNGGQELRVVWDVVADGQDLGALRTSDCLHWTSYWKTANGD